MPFFTRMRSNFGQKILTSLKLLQQVSSKEFQLNEKVVSWQYKKWITPCERLWITRGQGKLRLSRWNFRQNWQKWLNLFQTFFMSPKFMQKCSKLYGFSLKTSAKQRFLFSLLLKRKCINQEKLNVKTLSRPYIKRTHQSYQLLLGHLGMLWTQTEGVRLGI